MTGVDDEQYGQRLSAYVVRRSGAEPVDEETVRTYVKQRLSGFAVPRDVYFVDELPRNETGKVVKCRLVPR